MKRYVVSEGCASRPEAAGVLSRKLPFYLAMEEWAAMRHDNDDIFFTWRVNPTVIFGRSQQIDAEVNLAYCQERGIEYYRRKSGGGCVFSDPGNLMLSYITHKQQSVPEIFACYASRVADVLNQLGIPAEVSGRNDILVEGRKVSGNAFYRTPGGASIVHGTMLVDSDLSAMANAITPSKSKLESKKVKSVESRVTLLRDYTRLSICELAESIADLLCDSSYTLTRDDIAEIQAIEQPYYEKSWIMGRANRSGATKRIERVGEINAEVATDDNGIISDINFTGDFFPISDIDATLIAPLRGVKYNQTEIAKVIARMDISKAIAGMTNEQFFNLII